MFQLLLCLCAICLVTANPILQTLPALSSPCSSHQPGSLTPFTIPTLLQPQTNPSTCQQHISCQNNPQQNFVQNQAITYQNLPIQNRIVQNQGTCQNQFSILPNGNIIQAPIKTCQTMPLKTCNSCQNNQMSQRNLNQEYFNKVFSNQALKTILDPNTKLYNQNGFEILRNPACNYVPNVVNNYIIVPPELFLDDCKKDKGTKKSRGRRAKNKKDTARKNQSESNDLQNQLNKSANGKKDNGEQAKVIEIENTGILQEKDAQNIMQIVEPQNNDPMQKLSENDIFITEYLPSIDRVQGKMIAKTEPIERQMEAPNLNIPTLPTNAYLPMTYMPTGVDSNANYNIFEQYLKQYENAYTRDINSLDSTVPVNAIGKTNNEKVITEHAAEKLNTTTVKKSKKRRNNVTSSPSNDNKVNAVHASRQDVNNPNHGPYTLKVNPGQYLNGNTGLSPAHHAESKHNNQLQAKLNTAQNQREEFVIQDLKRKFPFIPENVARDLIKYMKTELQNNHLGIPNFCYPMYPMNYEQFYNVPQINRNNNSNNRNQNGRNSSRKKNRNQKGHSHNDAKKNEVKPESLGNGNQMSSSNVNVNQVQEQKSQIEKENKNENQHTYILAHSKIKSEKEDKSNMEMGIQSKKEEKGSQIKENVTKICTTDSRLESVINKNDEKVKTIPEEVKGTKSELPFELQKQSLEKVHSDKFIGSPELGNEDVVPTIVENSLIDYYPDFTADNHAYLLSSMEEVSIRNIQEGRYHYTTDKNIELEELSRERRKHEQNKNQNLDDTTKHKNEYKTITFEVETAIQRPEEDKNIDEVIEFRTPPTLEKPDFETKRIEIKPKEDTFYELDKRYKFINSDKASTYSDAKTPQYNIKEKIPKSTVEKDLNLPFIETIFANSRVIKYGQNADPIDDPEDITVQEEVNESEGKDNKAKVESDRTLVYAQSIPGDPW